jgi:hypothetical protein
MDEHPVTDADVADGQEGEYYGEVYGSNARFEWFWWAVTWLTIPLFAAYLVYRVVT